jgi:hypothetical protein
MRRNISVPLNLQTGRDTVLRAMKLNTMDKVVDKITDMLNFSEYNMHILSSKHIPKADCMFSPSKYLTRKSHIKYNYLLILHTFFYILIMDGFQKCLTY